MIITTSLLLITAGPLLLITSRSVTTTYYFFITTFYYYIVYITTATTTYYHKGPKWVHYCQISQFAASNDHIVMAITTYFSNYYLLLQVTDCSNLQMTWKVQGRVCGHDKGGNNLFITRFHLSSAYIGERFTSNRLVAQISHLTAASELWSNHPATAWPGPVRFGSSVKP